MSEAKPDPAPTESPEPAAAPGDAAPVAATTGRPVPPQQPPGEIGGPRGLEPTRFGDWEFKGRCSDF